MSKVVELITCKLKEGASATDFLLCSDKLNKEFMSAQKGYITRQMLLGEDGLWYDYILWETMEDAKNCNKTIHDCPIAHELMGFMDMESCKFHHLSVERSY
jgi:hypothetical protein